MKKIFCILGITFFALSIISGCKGDKGDPGINGADGRDGRDGRDGNANVKVIFFTIFSSDWLVDANGDIYFNRFVSTSILNRSVVDSGLVLVYYDASPNQTRNVWAGLPVTTTTISASIFELYFYEIGNIQIVRRSPTISANNLRITKYYKAVIIPPAAMSLLNGVNTNDHDAVMRRINLSE